jgi:hypothetical protein
MLPKKSEPILFGFVLSGLMSCLVSGISTLRVAGMTEGFVATWMGAWMMAWLIAFPVVLIAAPFARRIVHKLIEV